MREKNLQMCHGFVFFVCFSIGHLSTAAHAKKPLRILFLVRLPKRKLFYFACKLLSIVYMGPLLISVLGPHLEQAPWVQTCIDNVDLEGLIFLMFSFLSGDVMSLHTLSLSPSKPSSDLGEEGFNRHIPVYTWVFSNLSRFLHTVLLGFSGISPSGKGGSLSDNDLSRTPIYEHNRMLLWVILLLWYIGVISLLCCLHRAFSPKG